MSAITLTQDQQAGLDAFSAFVINPNESVFVLSGYSGTGKTTLVKHMIKLLPNLFKMVKLITPDTRPMDVAFTATTNKAAEAFAQITRQEVRTIHSALGLRVHTDWKSGTTKLLPKSPVPQVERTILFIDEASYIDKDMLAYIFKLTRKCKIVFMGDPAQITAVGSSEAPVFHSGYKGATLTEVVRQAAGNPIIELSTLFRHTVNTGEFFSFEPDGYYIQHLPREKFYEEVKKEFLRPDWSYSDSKVLAWTNKCVIDYNHSINDLLKGTPDFQVEDYAVCNSYIGSKGYSIKTDHLVRITRKTTNQVSHDVAGTLYEVDNAWSYFMPEFLDDKLARLAKAVEHKEYSVIQDIKTTWIDLRAAFSCTINKSQGSTYRKVFIDLDDLKRCKDGNLLARLLYVAVSRASEQVILTGDLV